MLSESKDWKEGLIFLANCIIHLHMEYGIKGQSLLQGPAEQIISPYHSASLFHALDPISPGRFSMANKTNELFLYQFYCLQFFRSWGTQVVVVCCQLLPQSFVTTEKKPTNLSRASLMKKSFLTWVVFRGKSHLFVQTTHYHFEEVHFEWFFLEMP